MYKRGELSPEVNEELHRAVLASQVERIALESHIQGVEFSNLRQAEFDALNKDHEYRAPVDIRRVLEELSEPVTKEIGPWRVMNIRHWTTANGAGSGPNKWHKDGFPNDFYKVMIYTSDAGGIDIGKERFMGPCWVLFGEDEEHCGIAIKGKLRVATEITIQKAETLDLTQRVAGLNARWG